MEKWECPDCGRKFANEVPFDKSVIEVHAVGCCCGEEISKTSINKLKAAIALVIIHYKSEKKHGANTMKINDVIKDFQLLADID